MILSIHSCGYKSHADLLCKTPHRTLCLTLFYFFLVIRDIYTLYTYIYTHICIYIFSCGKGHLYTLYTDISMYMNVYTYTYIYIQVYIHTYIHTCIYLYLYTHMNIIAKYMSCTYLLWFCALFIYCGHLIQCFYLWTWIYLRLAQWRIGLGSWMHS